MKSVALIHSGKSFLPEMAAYKAYFESLGAEAEILVSPADSQLMPFDIWWYFMGFDVKFTHTGHRRFVVHEYASASTPPYARLKDYIKKHVNKKPDLRVSLNAEHHNRVFPNDGTPLIIRKQGIHACFFTQVEQPKAYDFIYTGSALAERKTADWLKAFTRMLPSAAILLVGNHEPHIKHAFAACKNIHFKTAVPVTALPDLLASSTYAVNFVPDVYPFNIQPSTKLQEYCASGCRVISNPYLWVNSFNTDLKAGLFLLEHDFRNLSLNALDTFTFGSPNMDSYRWQQIFHNMQIGHLLG